MCKAAVWISNTIIPTLQGETEENYDESRSDKDLNPGNPSDYELVYYPISDVLTAVLLKIGVRRIKHCSKIVLLLDCLTLKMKALQPSKRDRYLPMYTA